MKTTEQKVILGKLLSTENIIVDYSAECQNPYFDVTARRLVLPQWASLDEDVEDLMIGHEVGHALYTDPFKWHAALDEYDGKTQRIFKQVLNIVEDVRIEKNIQRKYPGLRRTMIAGYGVLLRDGFFGVKTEKEMHDLVLRIGLICTLSLAHECFSNSRTKQRSSLLPRWTRYKHSKMW
jgi:hypothetical protein